MIAGPAWAQSDNDDARIKALEARIEALEQQNKNLMDMVQQKAVPTSTPPIAGDGSADFVGSNSAYSYRMMDVGKDVNTKPLVMLQSLARGELNSRVTLSGGLTAIADYQRSDTAGKFGYLTRHPNSGNHQGKIVSEALIHSAQLALTGRLTDDITAYFELLYDPEQSFGSGTITDLNRNQIQLRRGWVMWGNLNKRPYYALIGKMDIPFGFNGTVSPFTPSTNYPAFAGLAYGAQVGYSAHGLNVRAMAIEGGAQFRSANTPVKNTAVPSRINNFAVDANYTFGLGANNAVMLGASYQHGTAYCQDYPVVHFMPCSDNTPAVAVYGTARIGDFTFIGEYAQTTKVWKGTAVPAVDPRIGRPVAPPQQIWLLNPNPLSVFKAVKPKSFTIGGRYDFGARLSELPSITQNRKNGVSLEFSRFIAGDDGSPWEGQSQVVLGFSHFLTRNLNLFAEGIYVDGFVPLNFLSGGNFANGGTWSDQDVDNELLVAGVQLAL